MAHVSIVAVGDELVGGHLADTNSAWLADHLRRRGLAVRRVVQLGDDAEAIAAEVRRGASDSALVFVCGGLGPTPDDLTRHGVAGALGVGLTVSDEARAQLEAFFENRGRRFEARDEIQVRLPEGARPVTNSCGTAPGFTCETGTGARIVAMPGVPRELREMVQGAEVSAILESLGVRRAPPIVRELTIVGLPESAIGEKLRDLMARGRDPRVGSYPKVAWLVLRVEGSAGEDGEGEARVARDVATIRERLGAHVLGEGDLHPATVVGERLIAEGTTVAVAESLTGGRLSDLLIGVPGISEVFLSGVVAYANAAKESLLGVRPETLAAHGAVSEECACEMAAGVRRAAGSDVGISTTGIAGPGGAVPDKPVGTVWFGLATAEGVSAVRRQMVGDRSQIRERSALFAIDLLRRHLG